MELDPLYKYDCKECYVKTYNNKIYIFNIKVVDMSRDGYLDALTSMNVDTESESERRRCLRELRIQVSEEIYAERTQTLCYDPSTNRWVNKSPLPLRDTDKRSYFEIFIHNGILNAVGRKGIITNGHAFYSYDEETDVWRVSERLAILSVRLLLLIIISFYYLFSLKGVAYEFRHWMDGFYNIQIYSGWFVHSRQSDWRWLANTTNSLL